MPSAPTPARAGYASTMPDGGALRYRAGGEAFRLIRERGLEPGLIRAFAGPASGPKWLVLAGIDQAVIGAGWLTRSYGGGRPPLLAGASAGAWRAMAMASSDPATTHRRLQERYIGQVFGRGATREEVSRAYRRMLADLFPALERRLLVGGEGIDLALHVTAARWGAGSSNRVLQAAALVTAAGLNALSAGTLRLLLRRVLFHTRPARWRVGFEGTVVRLDVDNLLPAALASGTIPLRMAPVRDVSGLPRGRFVDGGLADYHLNQRYLPPGEGIVLFPHFQRRIVPNWFDRYLERRRPGSDALAPVLQVYPAPGFVAALPGGGIPTRDDFLRLVDRPDVRIARWRETAARGTILGEQLLDDVARGRIPDLVEEM
jgi:hypothetical protein